MSSVTATKIRFYGIESPIPKILLWLVNDARAYATYNGKESSEGMCVDTSLYIVDKINQNEELSTRLLLPNVIEKFFYTRKDKRWHHAWVLFTYHYNNYILDVTADQFNPGFRKHNVPVRFENVVFGREDQFDYHYGDFSV